MAGVIVSGSAAKLPATRSRRPLGSMAVNSLMASGWPPTTTGS